MAQPLIKPACSLAMATPMSSETPKCDECRICHSASTVSNPLLSTCACRGTCTYVHAACVEEWIMRRMRAGTPLSVAVICELCQSQHAHQVEVPRAVYFLVGRGAWRRWAHVAYAMLIARRLVGETKLAGRLMKGVVGGQAGGRKKGGEEVGAAVLALITAVHYGLFLAIDVRLLWRAFLSWRETACSISVRDRNTLE